MMQFTSHDIDILARTIFGEAEGEGCEGQVAVGWVIRNRAETDLHHDGKPDWWGEGIAGVSLAPWQYSCWKDPARSKLMLAADLSNQAFRACLAAAAWVLGDKSIDPTHGSLNYKRFDASADWAVDHMPVVTIGSHQFYNDIDN
jgi:hypothetical protein